MCKFRKNIDMKDIEVKIVNDMLFKGVEICRCGARGGGYLVNEDEGYYYRCNDCDLPIAGSYHPNETRRSRYIDEYDD